MDMKTMRGYVSQHKTPCKDDKHILSLVPIKNHNGKVLKPYPNRKLYPCRVCYVFIGVLDDPCLDCFHTAHDCLACG